MRRGAITVAVLLLAVASAVAAQGTANPQSAPPPVQPPPVTFDVTVIGTTPLPGVGLPPLQVPGPVQTASAADIQKSGAIDLSDFLNRRMHGVFVNDVQNNPFQPDVNYRGYTASPLLGTPQGLSVYLDGVRLNQPFGEVVSWDLIPRIALASTTLMPGSNPIFGLNTLGGAVSLRTKDGRSHPGTTAQAAYGNNLRRSVEFEHGGETSSQRIGWYVAANVFAENGWRDDSPSDVRQLFGKVGWHHDQRDLIVSIGHADNSLTGNGLQDYRLLDGNYSSIYTKPDTTDNRSTLVNVVSEHRIGPGLALLANAYYRHIRSDTLNGDINEDALDQALYQPGAAERAALEAAGYGPIPASGLDASNTPFPSLRCIGNVLLNDEPAEKCNGLINRSGASQHNGGASAQVTHRAVVARRANVFTVGAGFDRSTVRFSQSTELGYLNPDRGITGLNAFGDGLTGGVADDEPYDTRVDLRGLVTSWSVFATDTLGLGDRTHLTLSGRFNRTTVENRDRINPGGGQGSLDGTHTFSRFNPGVGVTIDLRRGANAYGQYSEGSRAATSIELGCADPEEPCRLPNAMAGDPPLDQVVTRTFEAGIRGSHGRLAWNAGWFRAQNRDDILFVTSDQTGFGYFRNFGETLRQGLELGFRREGRVSFGAGYTFLRATFESEETVNGESNSSNDAAGSGEPGVEGVIAIQPGDRLPLIPQHMLKVFTDIELTTRASVNMDIIAAGRSYARGNENNRHQPDGTYYLGEGSVDGYAVLNAGARFDLTARIQLVGRLNNLLDRRYGTVAQLGPAGFTAAGTFVARPLPARDGEFPLRHTTFIAPGAPRAGSIALRIHF